jgi:hypothetical protein
MHFKPNINEKKIFEINQLYNNAEGNMFLCVQGKRRGNEFTGALIIGHDTSLNDQSASRSVRFLSRKRAKGTLCIGRGIDPSQTRRFGTAKNHPGRNFVTRPKTSSRIQYKK